MRIQSLLILCLGLLPALASAEQIRPGLWEFTSNMQSDGQAMPDMQQMLGQLQNLPPEQRQMMEQMMAKQGVKLGGAGVQLCLSEAQAKARDIPLQDPESGCTHKITERGADVWKFRFTCPDGQGEGETRFEGDTAFSTQINGVYGGRQSSMRSQARWVSADCGGLQPR
ncbi:DUF3617 domain-containing protein [Aquipseudomonas guryensis]|jgi:hypothetical protein|uniref:DUF3617 domain-containing protein n=1 Tax=Aquipseudomonas guryensis TaxID=2759165 RepID=A0A7W4D9N5_9GAMM|nr:DUF3617 domain-containing protein [Pseudomonas guryensis]MBB1518535.1 DUF3617 domain-containing protein [Pseudomonas guryensis]